MERNKTTAFNKKKFLWIGIVALNCSSNIFSVVAALVGDLEMVFLGPEASLAGYIVPLKQKVRECFQWSQNSFPNPPDRFDYLTGPFQKQCSGYHSPLGVLCDLVEGNRTRWIYFWFNCCECRTQIKIINK